MPNRFLTRTVEKRDVFSLTRSRTASLTASLGKMIWVGVLRSWSGPASSPPFVPVTTKPCKTIHHLRTEYETVNNKHSKFFTYYETTGNARRSCGAKDSFVLKIALIIMNDLNNEDTLGV